MGTAVLDGLLEAPAAKRAIVIDFLYLDLETCTRCRGKAQLAAEETSCCEPATQAT